MGMATMKALAPVACFTLAAATLILRAGGQPVLGQHGVAGYPSPGPAFPTSKPRYHFTRASGEMNDPNGLQVGSLRLCA